MTTVNMDRLLDACVSQGASDIHLVCNRPPVLRIDGQLRPLETKVLEPDDSVTNRSFRRRAEPTLGLPTAIKEDFVSLFLNKKAMSRWSCV